MPCSLVGVNPLFSQDSVSYRFVNHNCHVTDFVNYLELNGYYTAQWLLYVPAYSTLNILGSAHSVYLCVLCGSQNKERLFPYTTLTDWFV